MIQILLFISLRGCSNSVKILLTVRLYEKDKNEVHATRKRKEPLQQPQTLVVVLILLECLPYD